MLWRWLVRRWRVEVALWKCYRWARSHYDSYSQWYCATHSWAVRTFQFVVTVLVLGVGGMLLSFLVQGLVSFFQGL